MPTHPEDTRYYHSRTPVQSAREAAALASKWAREFAETHPEEDLPTSEGDDDAEG